MQSLLNMNPTGVILYSIVLVVTTVSIIVVLKAVVAAIKRLKLEKFNSPVVSFATAATSPQDHLTLEGGKDAEGTHDVKLDSANWSRHAYFNTLANIKIKGIKVACPSKVKQQFINEYVKIYCGTMHDKLLAWVETLTKTDGKDLVNITAVMNKIESECQTVLLDSQVNIEFRDKVLQIPIPKFLIDRFTHYYSFTQSAGFETLEMPLDSKFYSGWQEELNCILAQLYTITATNFVGMNCAIKTLNGELDQYLEKYVAKYYSHLAIIDYLND